MKNIFPSHAGLSIFTAAFIGSALIAIPVLASQPEPEISFYPENSWSVGESAGSCSIINTFNNGFTMSFHGGENWVEELNIDFAQSVFNPGQAYDISLTVPGVDHKIFAANGKTGQVLSIALQRQKDFYKALRTSSVLDMELDGNAFRFYLTGFNAAAGNFERCMASAGQPTGAMPSTENFLVNESIAFEQQAKSNAIIEILPEDPKPVIQEIPFTETRKIGGIVVPSIEEQAEKVPAFRKPISSRKRLSEQLAEQIQQDPELYAIDKKPSAPITSAELPEIPDLEIPVEREIIPVVAPREVLEVPDTLKTDIPVISKPRIISNAPEILEKLAALPAGEDVKKMDSAIETDPLEFIEPLEPLKPANLEPPIDALLAAKPSKEHAAVKQALDVEPSKAVPPALAPIPELAPELETAPIKTKTVTAPIKVNTENLSGNADFTKSDRFGGKSAKEMQELRRMVASLKAENRALNSELSTSLKESEEERLTISSENWNLERATMQFNEAERQIRRLGQQLQRERAKHNQEKYELESLLFDPKVTDQAQLAKLADLEQQLIDARRELERLKAKQQ